MWDSFASGVATSIMLNSHNGDGQNDFAVMEYMNITVVTSNKPYGIYDGSNPFFDGREIPKFDLEKGGVHSGHVQTGLRDPFCTVDNGKGKCQVINFSNTFKCLLFLFLSSPTTFGFYNVNVLPIICYPSGWLYSGGSWSRGSACFGCYKSKAQLEHH